MSRPAKPVLTMSAAEFEAYMARLAEQNRRLEQLAAEVRAASAAFAAVMWPQPQENR